MSIPEDDTLHTVQEVLDWFAGVKAFRNRTAASERDRVLRLFGDRYGCRHLSTCRGAHLLEFIEAHPALKAGWTRRRWIVTVCRPFNLAARLGLIERNPFNGVQVPRGGRGRDLSDQEFRALLRAAPAYFRRLLIFLRLTGARTCEARNLTWENIDFKRGVILLREHKTSHAGQMATPRKIVLSTAIVKLLAWIKRGRRQGFPPLDPTKALYTAEELGKAVRLTPRHAAALVLQHGLDSTPGPRRCILYPKATVETLRATQMRRGRFRSRDKTHPTYVFTNVDGEPWTLRAQSKLVLSLKKKAGLPADAKLYGTRHAFATNAILNGLDVTLVPELLGHRSLNTTMVYVHLSGRVEHLKEAAEIAAKLTSTSHAPSASR